MLARQDVDRLRVAAGERDILTPIPGDRLQKPPPPRDWMVERCFLRGTVALLSGDGGIGKSLLMQQLMTATVLGRPWLGLTVTPGRAAFLACEDDEDELHRRQWDINRHYGCEMADVIDAGLFLFGRVGRDNTLSRLDRKTWAMAPTDLLTAATHRCMQEGISYLVVDTATQTFAGNQNDEQQVVGFINQLRRVAVAIQGVVILTKHPSMSGRALGTGESGNTAWNNSVRSRFYLHNDKVNGLTLDAKKSNYGKADLSLLLRWERGAYVLNQAEAPAPWAGRFPD